MKIILKFIYKAMNQCLRNAFVKKCFECRYCMCIGSQQRYTRIYIYLKILVIKKNQFHRIVKFITINAIKLRLGNCRIGCIVVFMNKYLTICADDWSDEFNYMVCYVSKKLFAHSNCKRTNTRFLLLNFSRLLSN